MSDQGHEVRGDWTCCWAIAPWPIHQDKEKEEAMRKDGLNPDEWTCERTHVVHPMGDGTWKSWWYIKPWKRRQ